MYLRIWWYTIAQNPKLCTQTKITAPIWLERFVNSSSQGKVIVTASLLMTMALNGLFSWPTAKKFLSIKTKYSSYRAMIAHLTCWSDGLPFEIGKSPGYNDEITFFLFDWIEYLNKTMKIVLHNVRSLFLKQIHGHGFLYIRVLHLYRNQVSHSGIPY